MKLVVLAAGNGGRMGGVCKPMMPAGDGRGLLHHTLRLIEPYIDEGVVVTGCYHDQYRRATEGIDTPIRFVRNYFWQEAGNLPSIYLGLTAIGDAPYILTNADQVTGKACIAALVKRAAETGLGIGVKEGRVAEKHGYAGIACVESSLWRRRVQKRLSALLTASLEKQGERRGQSQWDLFYEPQQVDPPGWYFPAEHVVEIGPDFRVEIDTNDDLLEWEQRLMSERGAFVLEDAL